MRHTNYKYRENEYIKFTLWFILCIVVILFPFVLHDKSLIQDGDSFNQSFPLFVYIGQWLRACLRGEIRLFDFRLGLGDDVIHALNWHGFGDVTQILSMAVPYRYAEYAYAFVMILKLWLCGISFLIYIRRYVRHGEYRVIGALLYACSTYALGWGFNCWMFLAPMMTFPLILAGIDVICEEEDNFSNALLAGLLVQTLNGFYFLYMETLLAILYFGVKEYVILRNKISDRLKKLIRDGIRIFFVALLAVSLGAPLLIPSIAGYLQSSRTGSGQVVSIWEMIVYPLDFYRGVLSYLLIPNIYRNIFTLGYLPLIAIITVFFHRVSRNRVHRYLLLLFSLLYCIPLWGSAMNGFSYHTDRWLFAFTLIITVLAASGLDAETVLSKKEKILFYLCTCVLIILYLTDGDYYAGKSLSALIYGGIGILLPVAWNQRKKYSRLILPFAVCLIILNGLLVFCPRELGGSGYVFGFKGRGTVKKEIDRQVDSIEEVKGEFERRDMYAVSLGASLMKNFYGTTEYFSTLNGNTFEFYRNLCISPGTFGATWVLKGLDGRVELDALLSVRQVMEYTEDELESVYRYNTAYLPMGVTYQSWISLEQFEQLSPMEKEAALIKYVVLEENEERESKISVPKEVELDQSILEADKEENYTIELQNIVQDGKMLYAKEDAVIRVYLEDFCDCERGVPAKSELYVQLREMFLLDQGTADIGVGNKKIQLRNVNDDYYMGVDEFWINVTEWKSDHRGQYFDIRLPDGKGYSLEEIKVYQHEINYDAIEERKENALAHLEVGINRISGEADCAESALALFAIPYGEGWKAYVDGAEQPVYKADIGFLAIELDEGSHTVVLEYVTPGLIPGCICAVISLAALVIVYGRRRKRRITGD
ncbi:MAG: YfhO family protein [Lachnospiraceae bacterium]|nr:YfhO family protein [Lachnospiraceae bacterium]